MVEAYLIDLPTRAATRRFGARLAAVLRPGDIVFLEGALGAGKTFLVRATARALGVPAAEPITSPTFALVQPIGSGRHPIVHVDLYRIESPVELDALGLPEYLATAIVFVEWGARFADFIAPDGLVLTLRPREVERGRVVELVARGSRGADIVAALASA